MNSRSHFRNLIVLLALVLPAVAAPRWLDAAVYALRPAPEASCYTTMLDSSIGRPQTTRSTLTTFCTALYTAATTTLTSPATSTITARSTVTITSTDPGRTAKYTTTLWSMNTVIATETRIERVISATTSTTTITAASTALAQGSMRGLVVQDPVEIRERQFDVIPALDGDFHGGKVLRLSKYTQTVPGDVICYHSRSKCTTSTVTHTATSTATTGITTTIVATLTRAAYPSATTTTTVATTLLVTSTITVTSTTVSYNFIAAATATFWEACGQANIASSVNNIPIIDGELSSYTRHLSSQAGKTSAYDCCVAAQLNPLSAVWAWEPAEAKCHIFETDTCSRGQERGGTNKPIVSHTKGQPRYLMGNGNCGKWTDMKYE